MELISVVMIYLAAFWSFSFSAAVFYFAAAVLKAPEPPKAPNRWDTDREKLKEKLEALDDPEKLKKAFGQFISTRVGGRLYDLENSFGVFADEATTITTRLRVLMVVQVGLGVMVVGCVLTIGIAAVASS